MQQVKYLIQLVIIILVSFYDLRERRAPNILTLGGLALMLICAGLLGKRPLLDAGGGALFALTVLWAARSLTKGGLGWGDIKFAAFLGAGLGLRAIMLCFLVSSLLALGYAGLAALQGRFVRGTRLPFAPFLGLGALVALIFPGLGSVFGT